MRPSWSGRSEWCCGLAGLGLAWCLGSVGCAGPPTPLGVVDTSSVRIRLTRTACYGTCPVYSLEIAGDGRVSYDGRQHVAALGSREGSITRDQLASVLLAFERAGFLELARRDAASCVAVTDMPSVITAIAFDGREASVDHYLGCPEAPPELRALEETIDGIAGAERWVGHGTEPSR